MHAQVTLAVLAHGMRKILFASVVLVLIVGAVQPVSAASPPVITEGDSIFRGISKNGTPLAFALTLHATDPDVGDTLTWSVSSLAAHGNATASGTGLSLAVTYVPSADYMGDDSFVVQVDDGTGGTDSITVNVTVAPKVGLVTDVGGLVQGGLNRLAYLGLSRAETNLGIRKSLYEATSTDDYLPMLQQCADEGNKLCFAVSFTMEDAIAAAANSRPNTAFAFLDGWLPLYPANLRGVLFATKEVGYLAGALAGKMTGSQVIGTIGGMSTVADVVGFMDGYRNGAQCANPNVRVLSQYTGTFTDPNLGATVAQQMIAKGADVIFAPAGPTGAGAIQYSAGHGSWSIGVDTDQYITLFGSGSEPGAEKILSSAVKRFDNALYNTVNEYMAGMFTSGSVTYGLSKGGVGLAPYHEAGTSIPLATKNYVTTVRNRIINGTTNINITCRLSPASVGAQDGWILESNEASNLGGTLNAAATNLYIGDNIQDRQYRSILSFNTAPIPDNAVITKVQLRIRQQGIFGQNPFPTHGGLKFDIKQGSFYTLAGLQLPDFQASASLSPAGGFANVLSGGWYTATLGSTALTYINKIGNTQFRLRFNLDDNDDLGADYLIIYSGNAALASRPQLLISYRMP